MIFGNYIKKIKMKKYFLCVCAILLLPMISRAQTAKTWSLEQCVEYAVTNNLQLKQAGLSVEQANLQGWSARSAALPTVSGQFQPSLNFGRSVDPTTNTFASQTIFSNGYSVGGSYTLYAGGTIKNSIAQSAIDAAASTADAANMRNTIALNVAQSYLNVLLAEENLKTTNERLAQTQRQLVNMQKMIDAGALPAGNRLDIEAQQARDEQSIVQADNQVALAYLALKTLLNLPQSEPMTVIVPANITVPAAAELNALTAEGVYKIAEPTQPQVQAADLRRKSATVAIAVAKGRGLPTVQAQGSLRTNYSSLGKRISGYQTTDSYLGDVTFLGTTAPLVVSRASPILAENPYFSQLGENFSQAVAVTVNVPIYQANQTQIGVQRANIALKTADLQAEQVRRQLNSDVTRSIADAKAAQKTFAAAQKTLTALELAYANYEKRFEVGASNSFELTAARSNLDNAKINVLVSKYDYLFKLKVVDFYQGIPIKL
jgi:outer membrane protein